jgi:hypothetical protein
VVDIVTGWIKRGSNPGKAKRFFSSQNHPDKLRGPPSLLLSGHWGFFPPGKGAGT